MDSYQTDQQLVVNCYFNNNICLLSGKDIYTIFGPFNYETTIENPETKTMKIEFMSMNEAVGCYYNLKSIYNQNNSLQMNFTLTANQKNYLNKIQNFKKNPTTNIPSPQKFEAFESFDSSSQESIPFIPRRDQEKRMPDRRDMDRRDWERKEWERKEWERKEWERKEWERKEWERKEWERKEWERKELQRRELEIRELERKDIEKRKKLEFERREAVKREDLRREIERKELERKELERKVKENLGKKIIERRVTPPMAPIPFEGAKGMKGESILKKEEISTPDRRPNRSKERKYSDESPQYSDEDSPRRKYYSDSEDSYDRRDYSDSEDRSYSDDSYERSYSDDSREDGEIYSDEEPKEERKALRKVSGERRNPEEDLATRIQGLGISPSKVNPDPRNNPNLKPTAATAVSPNKPENSNVNNSEPGEELSEETETPVSMMPEGQDWKKKLEAFCVQKGQVAPIYRRIQNKTNSMWSCKVVTYKNEYAAGGEFRFRRQAVQCSSQVAYEKLVLWEKVLESKRTGKPAEKEAKPKKSSTKGQPSRRGKPVDEGGAPRPQRNNNNKNTVSYKPRTAFEPEPFNDPTSTPPQQQQKPTPTKQNRPAHPPRGDNSKPPNPRAPSFHPRQSQNYVQKNQHSPQQQMHIVPVPKEMRGNNNNFNNHHNNHHPQQAYPQEMRPNNNFQNNSNHFNPNYQNPRTPNESPHYTQRSPSHFEKF